MVSVFRIILNYLMVICITAGSVLSGGVNDADLKTIENNITGGLVSGALAPFQSSDIQDADTLVSLIVREDDGSCSFSDVDYKNTDRVNWLTKRHLNRAERLAVIYRTETDETKKNEYRDYVLGLLDYWIKNDFQNSNWWFNSLATPNTLGETALLMKADLSRKQVIRLGELIGRGSFTVDLTSRVRTGANLTDIAMSTIEFGALTGSRSSVRTAVRLVSKELEYKSGEGLHADGTFFQHGNRIYMGGYGVEFVSGMSRIIGMLSGTEYNFAEEPLSRLAGFIVDGLAGMSFGNTLDPTTMGRSVSRINSQPLNGLAPSLRKLAAVEEMPRRDEILAYAESIENDTKTDSGVRFFNEAKFTVIRNDDFYFSFRGGADNMLYAEIINDENILAYNSSFPGGTTIMRTGGEYRDIAPLLDYSMMPGATAVRETDAELRAHEDFTYRYLKGSYPSAYADGAAVSGAQTEHEGIKMTVTCFASDDAAFLLGAGFSDAKGRQLVTTIDQTRYAGDFRKEGNKAYHNGIKYELLEGGELNAVSETRTGSWNRNNLTYSDYPVSGDIFTVSFVNGGSYAYSVMNENTEASVAIIRNDSSCQAVVLPDGRVAAAFFAKTSFSYGGRTFSGSPGEAIIEAV